jgi:L-lactate dehydrogenase complex protein LldG
MTGISREAFLSSIRQAIGSRREPAERPGGHEVARVVGASADVVEHFIAMARDAKMRVESIGTADLVDAVLARLRELGAKSVVITDEEFSERTAIVEAIKREGITIRELADRDAAFEADVGITGACCAIAETGSLVVRSSSAAARLASLSPPQHIAIVRADQVVADLLDWAANPATPRPANEVLITGPSKTSDIEMNLVMGVHGPMMVHIFLIR